MEREESIGGLPQMKESQEAGSGSDEPIRKRKYFDGVCGSASAEDDPQMKLRQLRGLSSRRQGIQGKPAVGRKIDSWRRLEIRSEAWREMQLAGMPETRSGTRPRI